MGKRITAFIVVMFLAFLMAGCDPGINILFNPNEAKIDLAEVDGDWEKDVKFMINSHGIGKIEIKDFILTMEVEENLNGEEFDEEEFLNELFADLLEFLDEEIEDSGYRFVHKIDYPILVGPLIGLEDEAGDFPGTINLKIPEELLEGLETKMGFDQEISVKLQAEITGQGGNLPVNTILEIKIVNHA